MPGFSIQDVSGEFPEKKHDYLVRVLADMVDQGLLHRITRNRYHIIPFSVDPDSNIPDGNQIAKCIMHNREYYIGYASALKILGVDIWSSYPGPEGGGTEKQGPEGGGPEKEGPERGGPEKQGPERGGPEKQGPEGGVPEKQGPEGGVPEKEGPDSGASNTKVQGDPVYIVTKTPMRPTIRNLGDINFQFINHNENRFFGFDSLWINQHEKAMVSDLEKTIVDIATKPCFGGGILGLGNALFKRFDYIEHTKLFHYFAWNQNKSARKRFLFLIDLLELGWTENHERLREELGSGISLLDQSAPDQGERMMKFGLRINVDPDYIKNTILHINGWTGCNYGARLNRVHNKKPPYKKM